MILLSPLGAAGAVGAAALVFGFAALVLLATPPTGAAGAAGLVPFGARRARVRPPRPPVLRRVLTMSSRDWSSFPDILDIFEGRKLFVFEVCCMIGGSVRISTRRRPSCTTIDGSDRRWQGRQGRDLMRRVVFTLEE